MSRFRLLALLMVCLALPFTIAACGDDDDDGGGGADEDAITAAIETSVTSTDPADCGTLQTEAALEQLEMTAPDETALESCESSAADDTSNPDSVEVSDISVDGDTATASVTFTGGGFDGSTLELDMLNEDGQWKINGLTEISEFDFEAFQAALSEALTADPNVSPEAATCVNDAIAGAGSDEVQRIIVDGDDEAFFALLGSC